MQNRSKAYQAVIHYVWCYNWDIEYDMLVNLVSQFVEPSRARKYRLSTLRKAPSETDQATIFQGQKAIARKYINAAYRAGRIEFRPDPNNPSDGTIRRLVVTGTPPTTGGKFAKPTEERTSHPTGDT